MQRCGTCKHWNNVEGPWGFCHFPLGSMPIWVYLNGNTNDSRMPENAGQTCRTYEAKPT